VATRLGLKDPEAEQLKRRPGDSTERVRAAVAPAVDDLATEVRLSFEYFENQFDRGVDEVLLSGGGARLAGLAEDLGRVVDRPTWRGIPPGTCRSRPIVWTPAPSASTRGAGHRRGLASRLRRMPRP
jgi:hypothetical protein